MIKIPFTLLLVCFVLISCKSDSKTSSKLRNESGLFLQEGTQDNSVKSLSTSRKVDNFNLGNKAYESIIVLAPSNELPKVESEMGELYLDNTIQLTLNHNAQTIFERRFTKKDFASVIDDSFLNKAILDGMVFNNCTSAAISYTVSLCFPQTDLCIPVLITISKEGKYSISKSEQLEDEYQSFME